MKDTTMKNMTVKVGMKIGATVGGLAFLIFGIMPGFYFGSYGTLILIQKVFGGPVDPTLLVRAAVVVGVLVGLFCMASVSIVTGGLLGSLFGWIVSVPQQLKEKKAEAKA